MEKVATAAGDYTVYRGSEAPRRRDEHDAGKWYFEPGDYVGFSIFSEPYATIDAARQAAIECGEREERLRNEIGGGG
jgi:hypothetical protein